MSYQNVKDYRARLKDRMVYVMGSKCQCCDYDNCTQALEFHHLDPTQKDFSFASNTNRSWQNVRQELPKCILVCANCHREIHAGLIPNEKLISSFNEERAKEIDNLVTLKNKKTIHYCQDCGIEIWNGGQRCPKCAALARRTTNRPSREELKELIRTMPFTQIGEKYGVSDNAIRKWCKSENLPTTKNIINQYSNEEWQQI